MLPPDMTRRFQDQVKSFQIPNVMMDRRGDASPDLTDHTETLVLKTQSHMTSSSR